MKRFLAPLALTLGLVLVVAAAASLRSGPADHTAQAQIASGPAGPAVADVEPPAPVQAAADSTAPAVQAEDPAPKTGCGKAVPCPNRDCKDCPANRYLK
jgi:hypothetical protein